MAVIESKGDGFSLFNGVKLPSLPVWNKETYPYAFIGLNSSGANVLMAVTHQYIWDAEKNKITLPKHTLCMWSALKDAQEWTAMVLDMPMDVTHLSQQEIWANHDIINTTDNSVHLAASEPISLDGMNVIEWDGNTEGLHGTAYRVSSVTDVDISKPVVLIRHNTDDTKHILNKVMTYVEDGTYKLGYSRYIPVANETYSSGVYFVKMSFGGSYMYGELLAYYPIEEVSGGKTTISFNNKEYSIDTAALSPATSALKSHLSAVMSGSGAVINLGGTAYNVDSAKLTAITNAFVQHLGTIAGNDYKVVVGGVEYGVDAAKVASAVNALEDSLGDLIAEALGEPIATLNVSADINSNVIASFYSLGDNDGMGTKYLLVISGSGKMLWGENTDMELMRLRISKTNIIKGTISGDVTNIGEKTFRGTSMVSISIPDGVTDIEKEAFTNNYCLTSIDVPKSVVSIGMRAFYNTTFTSINYAGTIAQWGKISFGSDWDYGITLNDDTGEILGENNYTIYCTDGTIAKDGTITYYTT